METKNKEEKQNIILECMDNYKKLRDESREEAKKPFNIFRRMLIKGYIAIGIYLYFTSTLFQYHMYINAEGPEFLKGLFTYIVFWLPMLIRKMFNTY